MSVFNNLEEKVSGNKMADNIVNELLLSANELNIYGSSSLIGYNTADIAADDELMLDQIKVNPQNAYQRILKNKLNKLKQQQPSTADFYVKPVPK